MLEMCLTIAFFSGALVLAFALWASVIGHCFKFRVSGAEEANCWLLFALAVFASVAVLKMAPWVYACGVTSAAHAAEFGGPNWFPVALVAYPVGLICGIAKFVPKMGLVGR